MSYKKSSWLHNNLCCELLGGQSQIAAQLTEPTCQQQQQLAAVTHYTGDVLSLIFFEHEFNRWEILTCCTSKLSFKVDFFLYCNSSICFLEDQISPYTFNQQMRVASKSNSEKVFSPHLMRK